MGQYETTVVMMLSKYSLRKYPFFRGRMVGFEIEMGRRVSLPCFLKCRLS